MASYRARVLFDWGSGRCLWAADDRTRDAFGYPIDHQGLGLPSDLVAELDRLIAWHDAAVNWDYPPHPGPWREPECQAHNAAVATALAELRIRLAGDWDLVDETTPLHEDPDLDRYLADPQGFRR